MRYRVVLLTLFFLLIISSSSIGETSQYWDTNTGGVEAESPHDVYTNNTNVCSSCHSTHLGKAEKLLLAETVRDSCLFCHDGRGSNYDVKNGKTFMKTSSETGIIVDSISGGFDVDTFTSTHAIEEMNAPEGGSGETIFLTCTSCHNPHGSDNYRLIPFLINGKDIRVKGSITHSPLTNREVASYQSGISEMCSTCHNDYIYTNAEEGTYDKTQHRHPIGVGLDSGDEILFSTLPTEGAPSGAYPLPDTATTTGGALSSGNYHYIITASNVTVNVDGVESLLESHQGYIKTVSSVPAGGEVTLKWQNITNALHYSVYRAGPILDQPTDLTQYKLISSSNTDGTLFQYQEDEQGIGYFTFVDNGSITPSLQNPPEAKMDSPPRARVACNTCHFAHGTKKVDVSTGESKLRRLDNNGTCQDCHKK